MTETITGFFAFPSSPPSCGDAIAAAVTAINDNEEVNLTTWTSCRIGGRILIDTILSEIVKADIFLGDLTDVNLNVLFELGYAIAKQKRIWLIVDRSYRDTARKLSQLRLVSAIGYRPYTNSQEIRSAFYADNPHHTLDETVFHQSIERSLPVGATRGVFYLKSRTNNQAGLRIDSLVADTSNSIIDDPNEGAAQSLVRYAEIVWSARGVLCHLLSPSRHTSDLDNPRQAFASGLAVGFDKPLLILAEGAFLAPVDYGHLVHHYTSARNASEELEKWLKSNELTASIQPEKTMQTRHLALKTDLGGLDIGDHVAENEESNLISEYFVETQAYHNAVLGKQWLFVGRKGSGKTANFLKVRSTLESDRRNLICTLKPASYEFKGLVSVLRHLQAEDKKGYALEALWKYLLCTEIAATYAARLREQEAATLTAEDMDFLRTAEAPEFGTNLSFGLRLEHCVEALQKGTGDPSTGLSQTTAAISEALHAKHMPRLIGHLLKHLRNFERICVLVDNLDKAWEREADLPLLCEVLFALFGAVKRVSSEFGKGQRGSSGLLVTFALFLRADIFEKVRELAHEPDKLTPVKLLWNDKSLLLRVLEDRIAASHPDIEPVSVWDQYFCGAVSGKRASDFILEVCLPRPRDVILLTRTALGLAINRGHPRIEEDDLLSAEQEYSRFAFDSILVENGVSVSDLERILYEFAGCDPVISPRAVRQFVAKADVEEINPDAVIDHLIRSAFLGVETSPDEFEFLEDLHNYQRNLTLARKLAEREHRSPRYRINRAYWSFLGVRDESLSRHR